MDDSPITITACMSACMYLQMQNQQLTKHQSFWMMGGSRDNPPMHRENMQTPHRGAAAESQTTIKPNETIIIMIKYTREIGKWLPWAQRHKKTLHKANCLSASRFFFCCWSLTRCRRKKMTGRKGTCSSWRFKLHSFRDPPKDKKLWITDNRWTLHKACKQQ